MPPLPSVSLPDLVRDAAAQLAPGVVGSLVRLVSSSYLGGSRAATLKLLLEADSVHLLRSAEFIDALGAERLKSAHVLRVAFDMSSGPGSAVAAVTALLSAGALDAFSASAVAELHRAISGWRSAWGCSLAAPVALLSTFLSEFDTFEEAGRFLSLFVESDSCSLEHQDIDELLTTLLGDRQLADLGGEPQDLVGYLPDYAQAVGAALDHLHSPDSDGDEAGNLAGFVDDDTIHYDTSAEEDGVDDSDSGSSSSRSSSSIRGSAVAARAAHRPPPEPKKKAGAAVSVVEARSSAPIALRATVAASAAGANGRQRSWSATSGHSEQPPVVPSRKRLQRVSDMVAGSSTNGAAKAPLSGASKMARLERSAGDG